MVRLMHALREERRWITAAGLLFLISAILGYVNARSLDEALRTAGVWDRLERAVAVIRADPTFLKALTLIYWNNLKAVLSMMGLGIFLGVFPLMALVSNGAMLGVVLAKTAQKTGANPLWLLITTILPHGTLELPAAIVGAAYGMRLGMMVAWGIWGLVIGGQKEVAQRWRQLLERIPIVVVGILLFLLAAAAVESTLITIVAK
ncbi:stage II sporulation protein M [Polycladomyces subterraneus]|uniref:Stage II sporulation protein M n=1 Tax=Polycladomyces subterraneus TaxID=1016997 RepID=A0ABT8ILL2_9BACL|nr:stage II sporulation protein M [Polycladomyces subterraneus]MDN4593636.1 stage II sporulation protein M [Polycladomyces subterraneus]